LDTNVLSEPIRDVPNRKILSKLQMHVGSVATAAPAWNEFTFGIIRLGRAKRRRRYQAYRDDVIRQGLVILSYDQSSAEWHAEERAHLARKGATPPYVDGQIAAIAVVNDLTLVTQNTRDFRHFRKLRVVDWSQP
jgi:tRNA(fMet)-specific endonuclease VapC